ncbi:MAG TPA: fibronectin type III domain-containing protein [Solirubrobacteraceae bacterium]|nr:fibronectin type III domain-containing protein [Solirubrobacteraceae bacterium]
MRLHRHRLATAVVAALMASAATWLAGPQLAQALFSATATGGPQTLASSTLAPATGLSASQLECHKSKSPEVALKWSASGSEYVSSYAVERAAAKSGPFTTLATVQATQRSYTDGASLGYSTTYYYRVSAVLDSWTAPSATASVTTSSKSCQ